MGLIAGMLFATSLSHHLLTRSESEVKRLESLLLSKEASLVRANRTLKDIKDTSKSWLPNQRSNNTRCSDILDLEINSMNRQIKKLKKSSKKYTKVFLKLDKIYWREK